MEIVDFIQDQNQLTPLETFSAPHADFKTSCTSWQGTDGRSVVLSKRLSYDFLPIFDRYRMTTILPNPFKISLVPMLIIR